MHRQCYNRPWKNTVNALANGASIPRRSGDWEPTASSDPLDLAMLRPLMDLTSGITAVTIGLIDGPVAMQHPDLARDRIRHIPGAGSSACAGADSTACLHGTFVAGILFARRGSTAPAICPSCTLLVRPLFAEPPAGATHMPSATPKELAAAIIECIEAGARVINLSLGVERPSTRGEESLDDALGQALARGVIVVAAAGNQSTVGGSAITRHPWVIPVAACDGRGRPANGSNLGSSIGRRGLSAPGDGITSLGAGGASLTVGGTSAAVAFVTGATALLWSAFPSATAAQVKRAVTLAAGPRRASVVPPLLNAAAAYQLLATTMEGGQGA